MGQWRGGAWREMKGGRTGSGWRGGGGGGGFWECISRGRRGAEGGGMKEKNASYPFKTLISCT